MAPGFVENLWIYDVIPAYSSWCCSAIIGECVSFLYKVPTQTGKTTYQVMGQTYSEFFCHQRATQKSVKDIQVAI